MSHLKMGGSWWVWLCAQYLCIRSVELCSLLLFVPQLPPTFPMCLRLHNHTLSRPTSGARKHGARGESQSLPHPISSLSLHHGCYFTFSLVQFKLPKLLVKRITRLCYILQRASAQVEGPTRLTWARPQPLSGLSP